MARVALPDNADPEAAGRAHGRPPSFHGGGVGDEVGDRVWDGGLGGLKQPGQAEERRLDVEERQCRAAGHHRLDAGRAGHQFGQGRRAFQHHPAAPGCHHGRVADELDGVAVALLGMDQDAFAAEVRAIPPGFGEVPRLGREVVRLPAPLVFLPALGEAPCEEQRLGPVTVRFGVVGIDAEGAIVARQGGVQRAPFLQGDAKVGMDLGALRRPRQGPFIGGDGLVEAAFGPEHVAQVGERLDVAGVYLNGAAVTGGGLVPAALVLVRQAEGEMGVGEGGVGRDGALEARRRVVRTVLFAHRQADVVMGLGQVGLQIQRPAPTRDGVLPRAPVGQGAAEIGKDLGVGGLELEGKAQGRRRLFGAPRRLAHSAQVGVVERHAAIDFDGPAHHRLGLIEAAVLKGDDAP